MRRHPESHSKSFSYGEYTLSRAKRSRNHAGRRGRCLAEIERMTSLPGAVGSMPASARRNALVIRSWMAGKSRSAADESTMWRTTLPLPFRRPFGSGKPTPWRKNRVTHRGYSAIEKIARRPVRRARNHGQGVVVVVHQLHRAGQSRAHLPQTIAASAATAGVNLSRKESSWLFGERPSRTDVAAGSAPTLPETRDPVRASPPRASASACPPVTVDDRFRGGFQHLQAVESLQNAPPVTRTPSFSSSARAARRHPASSPRRRTASRRASGDLANHDVAFRNRAAVERRARHAERGGIHRIGIDDGADPRCCR